MEKKLIKIPIWDWQKIEGTKNIPNFNKQVLLLEKTDKKCYTMVGSLKSIDSKGCNWVLGMRNINIFYPFYNLEISEITKQDNTKFSPTHWCEIQMPKD